MRRIGITIATLGGACLLVSGCQKDTSIQSNAAAESEIARQIGKGAEVEGKGSFQWTSIPTRPFTRIRSDLMMPVEIIAGPEDKVEFFAPPNVSALLSTRVEKGLLRFRFAKSFQTTGSRDDEEPRMRITVRNLEQLEATGWERISVSGIDVSSLELTAEGGSKIRATGTANEVTSNAYGSSTIDLTDLATKSVTLEVIGASTIYCGATSIKGKASGASKVIHKPGAKLDIQTSGASSVEERS